MNLKCQHLDHGLVITQSQKIHPCCSFKSDSNWPEILGQTDLNNFHQTPSVIAIKQQLANGSWPTECNQCHEEEQRGHQSWRTIGDYLIKDYSDGELFAEIRMGSTCNLACNTCNPEDSSRVEAVWKKISFPFDAVKRPDYEKMLEPVKQLFPKLKRISVLGGEPFYDRGCLALLEELTKVERRLDISISTNGSVVDLDLIQRLSQHNLILTFSIDGVGIYNENIRYGSNFATLVDNYNTVGSYPHVHRHITSTISLYNILHIDKLTEYLLSLKPEHLHYVFVTDPDIQNIKYLPAKLIRLAKSNIAKAKRYVKLAKIDQHEREFLLGFLHLCKYTVGTEQDPIKTQQFLNFTQQIDALKDSNFTNLQSEWLTVCR